jgi:hypothetical protein
MEEENESELEISPRGKPKGHLQGNVVIYQTSLPGRAPRSSREQKLTTLPIVSDEVERERQIPLPSVRYSRSQDEDIVPNIRKLGPEPIARGGRKGTEIEQKRGGE